MKFTWDWTTVGDVLPKLLIHFVQITLVVTVVSTIIAAILGLIIALLRWSAPKPVSAAIKFVVDFIRMTPIVIQLLLVYFTFLSLDALTCAIIVFGIHYSTYMAEVYRAGIEDVPRGQWEAATALSMPRSRTWVAVIIPQALRSTVPALGNYAISMFKDTPFVIIIGLVDVVQAAINYGGNTFRYVEPITLVGLIFLAASYPTSLLIGRLEKRLAFKN